MTDFSGKELIVCVFVFALVAVATPHSAALPSQSLQPDRLQEDLVAKLFEQIRASHKLPRLNRIRSRKELEQETCTAAVHQIKKTWVIFGSARYTTATPGIATPELETVASTNHPNAGFKRYSVAVWSVEASDQRTQQFLISVHLYPSTGLEFFDNNFTDEIFYKNDWKKGIVPECRNFD